MKEEIKIGEKTYYVAKPGAEDESKARLYQSRVFNKALENGACLKSQLEKILEQRNIWGAEERKEIREMSEKVQENLDRLDEGGFDVMEARKLAIETYRTRMEMLSKMAILREHNSLTAEGQADDAYFDALVSQCCFNEDGERVFKSYEDYLSKSKEQYAIDLANKLSKMIYGDLDYIRDFPENKFLVEFGFVNNELKYVDEEGNLVDSDYQPVKEEEKKPDRKPFLKNGQPLE